jgi:DNA-binding MarR family transcriptional regulator
MGTKLEQRLRQAHFQSPYQEATINILLAAEHIRTAMDRLCQDHGITRSQYNVLRILRGVHPHGHPRREILCRMIERSPDATRLIDRLEKMELAVRQRSEEDRRLSVTLITKKGLKLLEKMEKSVSTMDNSVVETLSAKECKTLSTICEKIYEVE